MKYLKAPMLSMNFSENKEGMKKRIGNILSDGKKNGGKFWLYLIVLCVAVVGIFVGCKAKDNEVDKDSEKLKNNSVFATDLESAMTQAIFSENISKYVSGEASAEGHIILDTVHENENVTVYALTTYGEYGFENGIFTKVAGTGVIPAKIVFNNENDRYSLVEYSMPADGSDYADSLKTLFPSRLVGRALNYTDNDAEKCYQQEYQYAKEYLTSIGRDAEVNFKVKYNLANMNVKVSNSLLDLYHDYPYWIGTQEQIEHGVRYVYEKLWEDRGNGDGVVTFKKYKYDDNEVVEEYVIDIRDGKTSYLKGEERSVRAENSVAKEVALGSTVEIDLDGDGKKETVFYSLNDFKINGVSYKNAIEDVYLDNPVTDVFIIADIDKQDKQKEIVLKSDGPSDDPAAYFFTYKNGLFRLGKAETSLNYQSFDGEGNFYGDVRLNILQTWFAPESWSLKDNKIVRNTDHIYYPNQSFDNKVYLKEELPVVDNFLDSKQPKIVKPQEVRITRTDNKAVCYLEAADGTTGWFMVTDFFKIVELDNKIATDVFDGLCMAD